MKLFFALALSFFATFANAADLDFGNIEFVPNSTGMQATLSSINGRLICNNFTSYTCPLVGTPGNYTITGQAGSSYSVSCDSDATISNSATNLKIDNMEYYVSNKLTKCRGLNFPPDNFIISSNPAMNVLYTGARMTVPSGVKEKNLEGAYETGSPGGKPYKIKILYQ